MADIAGQYSFYTACPQGGMLIPNASPSGPFAGSLAPSGEGIFAISGTYDAQTNAISFSESRSPGEFFLARSYSGFVFPNPPDGSGGVCAMAGTYQEFTIQLPPGTGFQTTQGGWYAIYTGPYVQ